MTKEDILIRLIPVISDSLARPAGDILLTHNFTNDLGADSLDIAQLAADIEKEFDIVFSDIEIEKISTVQDAVDILESRLLS